MWKLFQKTKVAPFVRGLEVWRNIGFGNLPTERFTLNTKVVIYDLLYPAGHIKRMALTSLT